MIHCDLIRQLLACLNITTHSVINKTSHELQETSELFAIGTIRDVTSVM